MTVAFDAGRSSDWRPRSPAGSSYEWRAQRPAGSSRLLEEWKGRPRPEEARILSFPDRYALETGEEQREKNLALASLLGEWIGEADSSDRERDRFWEEIEAEIEAERGP